MPPSEGPMTPALPGTMTPASRVWGGAGGGGGAGAGAGGVAGRRGGVGGGGVAVAGEGVALWGVGAGVAFPIDDPGASTAARGGGVPPSPRAQRRGTYVGRVGGVGRVM